MRELKRSALERLAERIEALPDSTRPIVYGAAVVLLWRGGFIFLPLIAVFVLFTSHTPLADLATGATGVGLLILGGALGGASYSLIGRHLLQWGRVGRYVAGITTVMPYLGMVMVVDRVLKLTPNNGPIADDLAFVAGMSVLFGIMMGEIWFGDNTPMTPERERRRIVKLLAVGAVLIVSLLWYVRTYMPNR